VPFSRVPANPESQLNLLWIPRKARESAEVAALLRSK
jgi:hypothetical protein